LAEATSTLPDNPCIKRQQVKESEPPVTVIAVGRRKNDGFVPGNPVSKNSQKASPNDPQEKK
jgi:hypothetical protein